MRVKSAELGEKISKASFLPTLGAGGNLRTNYSNKGFNSTLVGTEYQNRTLLINNQEVKVGFPSPLFDFEKIPYFDQFTNNLSYGVGISLNIPVYNNYTSRAGLQRAQLNTERANLNLLQTRETLKITVGQALSDAKAAKAKFQATNKTKTAQSNLYNNAVKRFEIGNLNAFELTRLKTQLESASINNIIAKYDYLFRTKILDFYLGKPIKLTK